jgi:hypothetical protein
VSCVARVGRGVDQAGSTQRSTRDKKRGARGSVGAGLEGACGR